MYYRDGSKVVLGDQVFVPGPTGQARVRVVMLGDTREHLAIDPQFLSWVESAGVLRSSAVVVEWPENNPFAHDDPSFAPVGRYMFTDVDEWVELQARTDTHDD